MSLEQAARDLTEAVSGIDYDGAAVHRCRVALHAGMAAASVDELTAALQILVDRIASARVDDADGVAFAALTAGALVETGAPAGPLAAVLLVQVPLFLAAARRFADTCLADLSSEDDDEEQQQQQQQHPPPPEDQVLAEVDGRRITHYVFRSHVPSDRGGASALALLQPWTLPAVAALSRDRAALRDAAAAGSPLRDAALALAQSHAQWLAILLSAQLDAPWLVLCPRERCGFRMLVDGVVSNYDLHALIGDVLVDNGLSAPRNPPTLIAYIKGEAPARGDVESVSGQFQFYEWPAAAYDWEDADAAHPAGHHVWGEGIPNGVPRFKDVPTLIVGPQTVQRSWNNPRTFGGLRCNVSVTEELTENEVTSLLAEMKAAAAQSDRREIAKEGVDTEP
ncbi:hypothetical protein BB8028_0008g01980 [Beauveria bassiana]|uniref:Uncharacterized protein n=2 Tax=Beauveria bassiana TaxID=176275 RepID=A0A2S7YND4_BEABA|nr:hypothetical protein BB8028_0008g01980 [Beauveria bassiana]